jgi:hypothetical protein
MEELEGTLLLPTAREVNDDAPSAVPTAHFEYEEVDVTSAPDDVPTAPLIPKYEDPESREARENLKTAVAKRHGLQQAEVEKEELTRADINTFAINYHTERQVEEANRIARERNLQGVQIDKDNWLGKEERGTDGRTEGEPAFPPVQHGEYQVAEYEVAEYDVDDVYKVSEYKSIYENDS